MLIFWQKDQMSYLWHNHAVFLKLGEKSYKNIHKDMYILVQKNREGTVASEFAQEMIEEWMFTFPQNKYTVICSLAQPMIFPPLK